MIHPELKQCAIVILLFQSFDGAVSAYLESIVQNPMRDSQPQGKVSSLTLKRCTLGDTTTLADASVVRGLKDKYEAQEG